MADDTESLVQPRAEESRPAPRPRGVTPSGDWLFDKEGHVFGPVAGSEISTLLSNGTLSPTTRIRREGDAWRSLDSVPELRSIVEEWEARTRLEREIRAARVRTRRGKVARWTGVAIAAGTVVALVVAVAGVLAIRRPWETRNALLDGFEVSVTVGTARVARGDARAADQEIAVPEEIVRRDPHRRDSTDPPPGRRPAAIARRESTPPAAPAGGLVAAEYVPARIEQVVARSKETLAPCVSDEARRSPDLSGEIPIEFAIGNDGKVVELWIQDPRLRSGPLHDCLLATLRRWSFDRFGGQRPIVALSFHLSAR